MKRRKTSFNFPLPKSFDATCFVISIKKKEQLSEEPNIEVITLGAGCFWCIEAIFKLIEGVEEVRSGYSGGELKNPTYEQVCSGTTGHAEVINVSFRPEMISIEEILEVFWKSHVPTTLNRQGNDVGPHYRSVIFYHTAEQREIAEAYKEQLDLSGIYENPIVTEITQYTKFYPAEGYHDDYYNLNGEQPYCKFVVRPKIEKFQKEFKSKLKK